MKKPENIIKIENFPGLMLRKYSKLDRQSDSINLILQQAQEKQRL